MAKLNFNTMIVKYKDNFVATTRTLSEDESSIDIILDEVGINMLDEKIKKECIEFLKFILEQNEIKTTIIRDFMLCEKEEVEKLFGKFNV